MTSRRLLDASTRMLLNAADYIEKRGWCQNYAENEKREVCIVGAFFRVRGDMTYREYCNVVRKLETHTGAGNITAWNDEYGRTKEEVLAVLREVALS